MKGLEIGFTKSHINLYISISNRTQRDVSEKIFKVVFHIPTCNFYKKKYHNKYVYRNRCSRYQAYQSMQMALRSQVTSDPADE